MGSLYACFTNTPRFPEVGKTFGEVADEERTCETIDNLQVDAVNVKYHILKAWIISANAFAFSTDCCEEFLLQNFNAISNLHNIECNIMHFDYNSYLAFPGARH